MGMGTVGGFHNGEASLVCIMFVNLMDDINYLLRVFIEAECTNILQGILTR